MLRKDLKFRVHKLYEQCSVCGSESNEIRDMLLKITEEMKHIVEEIENIESKSS